MEINMSKAKEILDDFESIGNAGRHYCGIYYILNDFYIDGEYLVLETEERDGSCNWETFHIPTKLLDDKAGRKEWIRNWSKQKEIRKKIKSEKDSIKRNEEYIKIYNRGIDNLLYNETWRKTKAEKLKARIFKEKMEIERIQKGINDLNEKKDKEFDDIFPDLDEESKYIGARNFYSIVPTWRDICSKEEEE